jgi:hypothetical protein
MVFTPQTREKERHMAGAVKNFENPDETREFPNGRGAIVHLATGSAAEAWMQPGWKWSESVKPIAGTESCQMHHVGYCLAGSLHVVQNDGTELDITSGSVYEIEPGHDAWVVGDEAFNGLEFQSKTAEGYAKK